MSSGSSSQYNAEQVRQMYVRWKERPESVEPSWQAYFEGFERGQQEGGGASTPRQARRQLQVLQLILAYRSLGYLAARVSPLQAAPAQHPELSLERFGLGEDDLDQVFDAAGVCGAARAPLKELITLLEETYCGVIGVEYMHLADRGQRLWLQSSVEHHRNQPRLDRRSKLEVLRQLLDAAVLENVVAQQLPSQRLLSLAGMESLVPAMHTLVEASISHGVREIVMHLPLRGRLNLLVNILGKPYATVFSDFEAEGSKGLARDERYYRPYTSSYKSSEGTPLRLDLTAAPEEQALAGPVTLGRARARQGLQEGGHDGRQVLPLLVHEAGTFSASGLVAETLGLGRYPGYSVSGAVHLVLYEATPGDWLARSQPLADHCTDLAKAFQAPVIHVNADHPEAVVHAVELAFLFRQRFCHDAVVNLVGYRRHDLRGEDGSGAALERLVEGHAPVHELYMDYLRRTGALSQGQQERFVADFAADLKAAQEEVLYLRETHKGAAAQGEATRPLRAQPRRVTQSADTGVSQGTLQDIVHALCSVTEDFHPPEDLSQRLPVWMRLMEEQGMVDWELAEALALGSLLLDRVPIRMTGPTGARLPRSRRYARWQDARQPERSYTPLNHIRVSQARLQINDRPLSAGAVLGFEYGYSVESPEQLVIWEAHPDGTVGEIQSMLDHYLCQGSERWQYESGMVLLLPCGDEGRCPTQASLSLARLLACGALDNITVCVPSTPAQYFHLLRRQATAKSRRPLVVQVGRSLLRSKLAISPVTTLTNGDFKEILDDTMPPEVPRRLVFCSGEIFYQLVSGRGQMSIHDTVLVRIEQLYPFSTTRMRRILDLYRGVERVVWAQAEPQNLGAWCLMRGVLEQFFPRTEISYAGPPASACPAPPTQAEHLQQQRQVIRTALALS